jgi:hypothetical protein
MTGPRYMWAEDVAALLGIRVRTLHKMLMESKHLADAGLPLLPAHLPMPVEYVRRPFFNGHHYVSAMSPRWRSREIIEWQARRPGKGVPIAGHRARRKPAA